MRIVYVCVWWRCVSRGCVRILQKRWLDVANVTIKATRRFRNQHNDLKSSKECTHGQQCDREFKFPHCDTEFSQWQVVWRTVTFEIVQLFFSSFGEVNIQDVYFRGMYQEGFNFNYFLCSHFYLIHIIY